MIFQSYLSLSEGKPPFSHGFPMVFLWFSYGLLESPNSSRLSWQLFDAKAAATGHPNQETMAYESHWLDFYLNQAGTLSWLRGRLQWGYNGETAIEGLFHVVAMRY